MFTSETNSFDDRSLNGVALAEYQFKVSPLLLYQTLIDGLLTIKLSIKIDYAIPYHLWLAEYLQTGMILLGAEDAIPFLTTDIDKCIEVFCNTVKLLDH
jgi:hypothetical protein